MSNESNDEMMGRLVQLLIENRRVAFSFVLLDSKVACSVRIRECEEYDSAEYGEEYAPGEMFEVGPPKVESAVIETQFIFANLQEAGNAVLRERARILGVTWDDEG